VSDDGIRLKWLASWFYSLEECSSYQWRGHQWAQNLNQWDAEKKILSTPHWDQNSCSRLQLINWINMQQKRAIRAMVQIPKNIICKQYFKPLHILPLPSLYIYEILVYIKTNLNEFTANSKVHSHNTRRKDDLFIWPCNTSLCKNNFNNIGIRMLNQLPLSIKEIPVLYKFKRTLKAFLLDHCFCSVDEFLLFGAFV
jgi:hypothetical protein